MPFVDKKTIEKIGVLIEFSEQNASVLAEINSSIDENRSIINKKLDKIIEAQAELKLMTGKITDALEQISAVLSDSTINLDNTADAVNKGIKNFSKKSEKTLNAVNSGINDSTKALVDTAAALTRLCTEMIAEYNREVDESIRLLSAESLISNLPK